MSVGVVVVLGAVIGLALGIVVSVLTDLPLAPEAGLVLGGLIGWLSLWQLVSVDRRREDAGRVWRASSRERASSHGHGATETN